MKFFVYLLNFVFGNQFCQKKISFAGRKLETFNVESVMKPCLILVQTNLGYEILLDVKEIDVPETKDLGSRTEIYFNLSDHILFT